MGEIERFLACHGIGYAAPPAAPSDDGEHRAAFSYKWAAIQAGLGFIGKNGVFVHARYAQRVRISCLLIDRAMPAYRGEIASRCGACEVCVRSCPYGYITGKGWHAAVEREELVRYRECATKSKHDGDGVRYTCARCALFCTYAGNADIR